MPDLGWRDAIIQILTTRAESMHYTEIAEAIAEENLRTEFGATPARSVNTAICTSLNNEGDGSPFFRVGPGIYALRALAQQENANDREPTETSDDTGLINAFGMYWSRVDVAWNSSPKILGQQQLGSTPVDFCSQRGVYLLHDGRAVVYVGRTTEQPLGVRLRQHVSDRLNGRWDRFSWFGIYPVAESGQLNSAINCAYNLNLLIVTMEALLIEGLEPPQNRKRGDEFRAVEFLQVKDPEIERKKVFQMMDELRSKI